MLRDTAEYEYGRNCITLVFNAHPLFSPTYIGAPMLW